ncbi:hypothetical protein BDV39DRAFT_167398 [Aspergillus sergii]|uniref:Uncharacterized protein n=1 Tax=Aspergillus sergii TaxID=1034303 RepID=A0A5N6XHB0_9EURO|nr:hypothetical protein BDV39DRAFT_167398 [Aspergillus sergii]
MCKCVSTTSLNGPQPMKVRLFIKTILQTWGIHFLGAVLWFSLVKINELNFLIYTQ